VVLVPPLARISPLPTRASPGATLDLAVTLPTNTAAPWVYILDPSGGVVSWALPEDQRVRWTVPGEGSYTIEITGNSGNGPRALARWRLVAGAPSPEAPSATVATLDALVGAVNDLRRQSGLAPLRRDPLLGEVAARRARELAAALVLAHGAEGDGPVERLAESAVSARRVAENLARAPSLTDAHARLCASPSHRVVLLDPALDAVGVGVALTPTGVYLVELFAQAPALRTGP
jgi:uncharacterized protein YkwD